MARKGAEPRPKAPDRGDVVGRVLLQGGPFTGQGFYADHWRALVAERRATAERPGFRRSPFLDYELTTDITSKDGLGTFQVAVYRDPKGRT